MYVYYNKMVNTYKFRLFCSAVFSSVFLLLYPIAQINRYYVRCVYLLGLGTHTLSCFRDGVVRVRRSKSSPFVFSFFLSFTRYWVSAVCVLMCVLRNSSSRNETVQLWSIVSHLYSVSFIHVVSETTTALFVIYAKYFICSLARAIILNWEWTGIKSSNSSSSTKC